VSGLRITLARADGGLVPSSMGAIERVCFRWSEVTTPTDGNSIRRYYFFVGQHSGWRFLALRTSATTICATVATLPSRISGRADCVTRWNAPVARPFGPSATLRISPARPHATCLRDAGIAPAERRRSARPVMQSSPVQFWVLLSGDVYYEWISRWNQ